MKLDNNNLMEWAERYVKGTLNAQSLTQISQQLNANPALKQSWNEAVQFIKDLEGMRKHHQAKRLLSAVLESKQSNQQADTFIDKVVPFIRKYAATAGIAAAIAIIASTATFQIAKYSNDQSDNEFISLKRDIQSIKQSHDQLKQSITVSEADKNATAAQDANILGTGFALTNDGYLVTDYHVVEGAEAIYVQTNDSKYHKAFVVGFDKQNDIAILKILTSAFKFGNGDVPYHFSTKNASLAQSIFSLGFPQDDALYSEGYISSNKSLAGDKSSYQLDLDANPGQSGSPIFDVQGQVIGMLIGKQTYATYAVKTDKILELVKSLPAEYKIKLTDKNTLKQLSRTEQVKKALEYVCAVKVFK